MRRKQDASRLLQSAVSKDETLHSLLKRYHIPKKDVKKVQHVLNHEHDLWLKELERCEKRLAPSLSPSPTRAAMVMGVFYLAGGIFPLLPYFFLELKDAIIPSIILTAIVLFLLGAWKAKVTGGHWLKSAMEMSIISLSAAVLAYFLGILVSSLYVA